MSRTQRYRQTQAKMRNSPALAPRQPLQRRSALIFQRGLASLICSQQNEKWFAWHATSRFTREITDLSISFQQKKPLGLYIQNALGNWKPKHLLHQSNGWPVHRSVAVAWNRKSFCELWMCWAQPRSSSGCANDISSVLCFAAKLGESIPAEKCDKKVGHTERVWVEW